jgi:hypothetical protein
MKWFVALTLLLGVQLVSAQQQICILVQEPSGSFVDPREVIVVRVVKHEQKAAVIVALRNGGAFETADMNSEDAAKLRDQFAWTVLQCRLHRSRPPQND